MTLSVSEIKKLLKNWHFYKASISSERDGGELKRKLDAIERVAGAFDAADNALIKMRYFDCTEVGIIAKRMHVTERAVYKRLEKIAREIEYCLLGLVFE